MLIEIPVTVGELLDKITILMLNYEQTRELETGKQLESLSLLAREMNVLNDDFVKVLYAVNSLIFGIDDSLRGFEQENDFSEEFIDMARSIHKASDLKAKIKTEINEFFTENKS